MTQHDLDWKALEFGARIVAGDVLRAQKKEAGLNLREIAETMGTSVNWPSLIERAAATIPVNRVVELVEAYKGEPMLVPYLVYQARHDCFELFMEMVKALPDDIDIRDEQAVSKAISEWKQNKYGMTG